MIFSAAHRLAHSVGEPNFDQSLITTEVMLAQTMTGHVRTPGDGTTQLQALPCNRSDLEYPDYAEQCATLTATAQGAAAARQAFSLAYRLLRAPPGEAAGRSRVLPRNRIRTYLVGMSGPVPQQDRRPGYSPGWPCLPSSGMLTVSRFVTRRRRTWRFRHAKRAPAYLAPAATRRGGTEGQLPGASL